MYIIALSYNKGREIHKLNPVVYNCAAELLNFFFSLTCKS